MPALKIRKKYLFWTGALSGFFLAIAMGISTIELTAEEPQSERRIALAKKEIAGASCSVKSFADDMILRRVSNQAPKLDATYSPDKLVVLPKDLVRDGELMSARAELVEPLQNIITAGRAAGYNLHVNSAYRSHVKQNNLYYKTVNQLSQYQAAVPGFSEHQLGTAVDVSVYRAPSQENFWAGYRWLSENAYRYGFVISYPKGAKELTGIDYEPWHLRYVGVAYATFLQENTGLFNHFYNSLFFPIDTETATFVPHTFGGTTYETYVVSPWASVVERLTDSEQDSMTDEIRALVVGYFHKGQWQLESNERGISKHNIWQADSSSKISLGEGEELVHTRLVSNTGEYLEFVYDDEHDSYLVSRHNSPLQADEIVVFSSKNCTL